MLLEELKKTDWIRRTIKFNDLTDFFSDCLDILLYGRNYIVKRGY